MAQVTLNKISKEFVLVAGLSRTLIFQKRAILKQ